MTDHKINLSVERAMAMDEDEFYDLVDAYLKGRFDRYAVDIGTQELLEQHNRHADIRDPEYDEAFNSIRRQIHDLLYDPDILPRHRMILNQMKRMVDNQITSNELNLEQKMEDGTAGPEDQQQFRRWKKSAVWFRRLVQDELDRTSIVLAESSPDDVKARLEQLLDIIEEHRSAGDHELDHVEERLYGTADAIRSELV